MTALQNCCRARSYQWSLLTRTALSWTFHVDPSRQADGRSSPELRRQNQAQRLAWGLRMNALYVATFFEIKTSLLISHISINESSPREDTLKHIASKRDEANLSFITKAMAFLCVCQCVYVRVNSCTLWAFQRVWPNLPGRSRQGVCILNRIYTTSFPKRAMLFLNSKVWTDTVHY